MTILAPTRICGSSDPQWLDERKNGISASECAAACGVSEYQTPRELYHRKRGELPPIEENRAMRLGRKMESVIADEFELEAGMKIQDRQPGLFRHAEFNWILATPDGILTPTELIEVKKMNERRAEKSLGEQYTDQVPYEWNAQCQQQMFVMNASIVWMPVLVGSDDFRVYVVERHERAIEKILHRVNRLWKQIQTGNPPPIAESDYSLSLARNLFTKVEPEVVTLTDSAIGAWGRYEEAKQEMKHLETEADSAKAKVLMELENNTAGRLPDGRYVRRKMVEKKGYTVEPSSYVDVRVVKNL
jgi:putative phage-type endonuclease